MNDKLLRQEELSNDVAAVYHELRTHIDRIEGEMRARFEHGEARMTRIETLLTTNNSATEEVREIVVLGKSFFKVLGYIGNAVKWLVGLGAAVGGAWTAWHNWSK
jgi:hypothetical protein